MESCSTAAWPVPMSVIMASTSALWPCSSTSRLHPSQKHQSTSAKMDFAFESNSKKNISFVTARPWKQSGQNGSRHLSKVFILSRSLWASSLAAWASLCCDSKYVICFFVQNKTIKSKNEAVISRRTESEQTYSEGGTELLFYIDVFL